jgi:hypothetical protein
VQADGVLPVLGVEAPHVAQVGELVRREDCGGIRARRANLLTQSLLARDPVLNRGILGQSLDECRHGIAEALSDGADGQIAVLHGVMEHSGGDHGLRDTNLVQQLGNLDRVAQVRAVTASVRLARVGIGRQCERSRESLRPTSERRCLDRSVRRLAAHSARPSYS